MMQQLRIWTEEKKHLLSLPLLSDTFASSLYILTFILLLLTFILGLFSGMAMLSYHGHEPVNVIYFMAMVIVFPLFTMMLSLFAMLRANSTSSVFIHISPAFWLEKILEFLPSKTKENLQKIKLSPLLFNWIIIKRSQLMALSFSFGLFLALLAMVISKDIAFAWSTTLDISAEEFKDFLDFISLPWSGLFPSAVPSLDLIEQSHYFRLGDKVSTQMIAHASTLGKWWKFLAFATLFYAIFLRCLVFILSSFGLNRALEHSILSLKGAKKLLRQMNEPIISTHSRIENIDIRPKEEKIEIKKEIKQEEKEEEKTVAISNKKSYTNIQGWAMTYEQILLLSEYFAVNAKEYFEVGGSHSFEEDEDIISKSKGEVLVFVKAWEPPTMDFVDYIEDLSQKVKKINLLAVGTAENSYQAREEYVDIWENKLALIKNEKVCLQR